MTGGTSGGGTPPIVAGNGGTASGGTASGGTAGVPTTNGGAPPTPPEDDCALPPAGAVNFSVPSRTFEGTLMVELSTNEAGAEVRYTTDRTPPTATSPLYSAPLTFTLSTELRAQAFVQGTPIGAPQTAVYVARAFDAQHDLPVIVLDGYGSDPAGAGGSGGTGGAAGMGGAGGKFGGFPFPQQPTVDRSWKNAAVMTFEPDGGTTSFAKPPKMASGAAFHIRGQSSALYDKKPYRLEVRDGVGDDRDCPMLGMPSESDWVLHSPFPDKALIRNAFVYSLGPEIGLAAPRAKFAELYLNTAARPLDAADYQGVYLLVETIKNQKNRLDLKQLDADDVTLPAITGGYILSFEWQVTTIEQELVCPSGYSYCWDWLELRDPQPANAEQQAFIAQYLESVGAAIHSANPSDPMTGYPSVIDTASFINHIIVSELTRSIDAYTRSQYFHKDRGGKLVAGPLWDFDVTAGVGTSASFANIPTEGWHYETAATRFPATSDWFPTLIAEPAFRTALIARWKELRAGLLSDAQIAARIERLTTGLAAGAQRNFQKWNNLTTVRVGVFDTPTFDTWQGQVTGMRDWLAARAAWIDSQWQ